MGQTNRVQAIRADQDATLDEIERGVGNLHEASLAIQAELTTQSALLGDLSENVDNTQSRMQNQVGRATELSRKPSTWKLWVFILVATAALLFIVLY